MDDLKIHRTNIQNNGYTVLDDVYSPEQIQDIVAAITEVSQGSDAFRKTEDLFAIRRFLKEVPESESIIFNQSLKSLIDQFFGASFFVVKSIYFDKPEKSNWFVGWHQDLTISVNKRVDLPGFDFWTKKYEQYAVQPPIEFLETGFTIRIHLDDTDENNGALKVIPGSHLKNVLRPDKLDFEVEREEICQVRAGGIMMMRPLLMHASDRTTSNNQRRVIHIEFNRLELPVELEWAEKLTC